MKWITRDHVHMDRVASPWLIRRFIDQDAEFAFVPFGKEYIPAEGIAFGIPGAEIGTHDKNGSTFRKLMKRYSLTDPALETMCEIIESGIHHVFHHAEAGYSVADLKHCEGVGLDMIANGMLLTFPDDIENIERSMALYDALYNQCRAVLLLDARPDLAALRPPQLWDKLREELNKSR